MIYALPANNATQTQYAHCASEKQTHRIILYNDTARLELAQKQIHVIIVDGGAQLARGAARRSVVGGSVRFFLSPSAIAISPRARGGGGGGALIVLEGFN